MCGLELQGGCLLLAIRQSLLRSEKLEAALELEVYIGRTCPRDCYLPHRLASYWQGLTASKGLVLVQTPLC